jgi:hypothetical protein
MKVSVRAKANSTLRWLGVEAVDQRQVAVAVVGADRLAVGQQPVHPAARGEHPAHQPTTGRIVQVGIPMQARQ